MPCASAPGPPAVTKRIGDCATGVLPAAARLRAPPIVTGTPVDGAAIETSGRRRAARCGRAVVSSAGFSDLRDRDRRPGARSCVALACRRVAEHRDRHVLVGKAREKRAVAGGRSAVIDLAHAFVSADEQPERVAVRAAVVELARALLLGNERGVAHDRRVEVLVPLQQIADRGQQAAVAVDVLERHVGVERAVALVVGDRAALDDARVVVAPRGVGHAERLEQARRA